MIKPDSVIMYFGETDNCTCGKMGFKPVDIKDVFITLDLDNNEYIFEAKCPGCGTRGVNRRSM